MSQTLLLDTNVSPAIYPSSRPTRKLEYQIYTQKQEQARAGAQVRGSLLAAVVSTLLLRIAGRTSFVLLGFYFFH